MRDGQTSVRICHAALSATMIKGFFYWTSCVKRVAADLDEFDDELNCACSDPRQAGRACSPRPVPVALAKHAEAYPLHLQAVHDLLSR